MDRLVLGYGAVGRAFLDRLADRSESLLVLVETDERAESLRESGIDARRVDITAVGDVRTVAGEVDSVVVAPPDTDRIRQVVGTARLAYPAAFVMACLDEHARETDREAIAAEADRIVELPAETARPLIERVGDEGIRTRKLSHTLRGIDGTLAVLAHNNPDPDAIAAAVGLRRIATAVGVDAEACYYGEINHQENRALVNLFGYDLRNLSADNDLSEFDAFALVDHSRPGVNDDLPEETPIDIVIDHHPPRGPIEAEFVDLRSDVGATCTLLERYLSGLAIEPGEALASGLLYGIRTDTQAFSREVSVADFEAAARLVEAADGETLRRVESPTVTADTIETVGRAISNRSVESDVLTSCVGDISDRDTLSQAADRLLDMEGVTTTLVFGYTDGTVFVSARTRGTDIDLGEVLRDAFAQIGSAGGHADMAGAQIPVGMLAEESTEDERGEIIDEVVSERFLEALGVTPDRATAFVYSDLVDPGRGSAPRE
jgi:nanoRNase/pAp phosphatase (c-di-AMP/oligoRNAs hydrolase)